MMEIIAIQRCAAKRSGSRSNTMLSRRWRLNPAKRRSTTHLIPLGRKCPSRIPPGETETWMSCASAAVANGAPVKPLSQDVPAVTAAGAGRRRAEGGGRSAVLGVLVRSISPTSHFAYKL